MSAFAVTPGFCGGTSFGRWSLLAFSSTFATTSTALAAVRPIDTHGAGGDGKGMEGGIVSLVALAMFAEHSHIIM